MLYKAQLWLPNKNKNEKQVKFINTWWIGGKGAERSKEMLSEEGMNHIDLVKSDISEGIYLSSLVRSLY